MRMKNLYTVILLLIISTSGTFIFGQEQPSIESLYAQRRVQAQSGQDYLQTEREILSTGIYPTALVTTATSDESKSFNFRTYKLITPEKQDRIEQRLITSVNGLQSVEINNQQVEASFSSDATEENILLFFKLLGYTNYEIKN